MDPVMVMAVVMLAVSTTLTMVFIVNDLFINETLTVKVPICFLFAVMSFANIITVAQNMVTH